MMILTKRRRPCMDHDLRPILTYRRVGSNHDVALRNHAVHIRAHAGGIKPRRLAMILSTIRFGSTAIIKCRIGSGVIW